jgi:hypothetical protein
VNRQQEFVGAVGGQGEMAIGWVRSLEINAHKLEELARFYQAHGFLVAATLIAAASLEIRENLVSKKHRGIEEKSRCTTQ